MTYNKSVVDFCQTMFVVALSTVICGCGLSRINVRNLCSFKTEPRLSSALTAWLIWLVDAESAPSSLVANNIKKIFLSATKIGRGSEKVDELGALFSKSNPFTAD